MVSHLFQQASFLYLFQGKHNISCNLGHFLPPQCISRSDLCHFQDDFKLCSELISSVIVGIQLGQLVCPHNELYEDTCPVSFKCAGRYQSSAEKAETELRPPTHCKTCRHALKFCQGIAKQLHTKTSTGKCP